jgi:hypothetical protein
MMGISMAVDRSVGFLFASGRIPGVPMMRLVARRLLMRHDGDRQRNPNRNRQDERFSDRFLLIASPPAFALLRRR